MPAEKAYLYFIIVIMFNKQSIFHAYRRQKQIRAFYGMYKSLA